MTLKSGLCSLRAELFACQVLMAAILKFKMAAIILDIRRCEIIILSSFFSSPEHEALRVSYCDHSPSVGVRPAGRPSSVHISFFTLWVPRGSVVRCLTRNPRGPGFEPH